MNKVSLSPKYQVVIPKSARKLMGMNKLQKVMYISSVKAGEIVFRTTNPKVAQRTLGEFAGSLSSAKPNPIEQLRKLRDSEW